MYRTILLVLLSLLFASTTLGESSKPLATQDYQPELVYLGLYKADRLYQYNPYVDTWHSNKTHRTVASLRCFDASRALSKKGEWIGVLTEKGTCASPEEGQRWVTGNYLNYITHGVVADLPPKK